MTARIAAPLLTLAIMLGACSVEVAAPEAGGTLGELRSGVLELSLTAATDLGPVGFTLEGPFEIPVETGALPRAELTYTMLRGEQRSSVLLDSDGANATIEIAGTRSELSDEQLDGLRAVSGPAAGFDLTRWVFEPSTSDAGMIDGEPVDRVTGELDVAAVVGDLATLTAITTGSEPATIDDTERAQLAAAADEASIEFLLGREDRLLREGSLRLGFAADALPGLRAALGPYGGLEIALEIRIDDPNRTPAFDD